MIATFEPPDSTETAWTSERQSRQINDRLEQETKNDLWRDY
jgi:hypothetical protein